ncbi:hypothetical protein [Sphingorhabdus sp. 109]|jgi:hypothetical protein|uniref:hypothetical protein n=1 Tax=Sphingorhabdus sp. 109 TaxID=2653173 RepID=UPI0012F439B4|nr:hypothetical protein [Sphingorhabdus sp. 109]VWX56101.1 hypothetical protein SPHINGOR109_10176 [Sphingorhabdus sp. 109]
MPLYIYAVLQDAHDQHPVLCISARYGMRSVAARLLTALSFHPIHNLSTMRG